MTGFQEVKFEWRGETYTVPAEGQLMLVAKIEAAIRSATGMPTVPVLLQEGGPDPACLAMAFGAAIRHAGGNATDAEIYLSMQEGFAEADVTEALRVNDYVLALLSIVSPPVARKLMGSLDMDEAEKKPEAAT